MIKFGRRNCPNLANYLIQSICLLILLNKCASSTSPLNEQTPTKVINISPDTAPNSLIGSIADNQAESQMKPPFYIVPIIPEDVDLFDSYVRVDLENGNIYTKAKFTQVEKCKFSVLSINEGLALNILINVIDPSKSTTLISSTTTEPISTATTTKTSTETQTKTTTSTTNGIQNESKCLQESSIKMLQAKTKEAKFIYNCFSIEPRNPVKCSFDDNDSDLNWSGIVQFDCSSSKTKLNFLSRFDLIDENTIGFENILLDELNIESIKLLNKQEVSKNESIEGGEQNDSQQKKIHTRFSELQIELKCKSDQNIYLFDLFIANSNESSFLLVNYELNKLYTSSLLQKQKHYILTHSTEKRNCSTKTSTTTKATTKTESENHSLISNRNFLHENYTHLLRTTTKLVLTTSLLKLNMLNFNLKMIIFSTFSTILCIVLVSYILFSIFKRANCLLRNKNVSGTSGLFGFVSTTTLSSRQGKDDDDKQILKAEFLNPIMNRSKLMNSSLSTHTIDTRASMLLNDNDNTMTAASDLLTTANTTSNKYNFQLEKGAHDSYILTSDNPKNHSILEANNQCLFAYSEGYLNEMGINMMDNLRSLLSKNVNLTSTLNPNTNHGIKLEPTDLYNQLILLNSSHQNDPNNVLLQSHSNPHCSLNQFDMNSNKWKDLLNWNVDYRQFQNVFNELKLLK